MSASAVHKHIVSTYIQIVSSVLARTALGSSHCLLLLLLCFLPLLVFVSYAATGAHGVLTGAGLGLGAPRLLPLGGPFLGSLSAAWRGGGGCETASRGRLDNFLVSALIRKPLLRGSLLVGPWQSTPRPLANFYRTPKSIGCEL